MQTTIVITPRERFSQLEASLRSLFSTIPDDVPVVLYDAGAPEVVRQPLRALRAERPFLHVETEGFLLAPQVRNLARAHVETKYVCYCDNDLRYTEGWLEALEANAERTGAAAVAPLTLIGPLPEARIHHAGSWIKVRRDGKGRLRLKSVHRLDNEPLQRAIDNGFSGAPEENNEFEYHCAFLRTDVIDEIGGHDERQTKHDHLNDALRIQMHGHKITFEKTAVIQYNALDPFKDYDWPFFFYRWTDEDSRMSDRTIGACWGARKNYEDTELAFVRMHRQRALGTIMPGWVKTQPFGVVRQVWSGWQLRKWRGTVTERRAEGRHVPSPPPADGLAKASIPGADLIAAA